MDNLETIRELCTICEMQNNIIRAQSDALSQLGAMVMEEDKAAIKTAIENKGSEQLWLGVDDSSDNYFEVDPPSEEDFEMPKERDIRRA